MKTTIDNITSVVNVLTDNITTYANKALNNVKNEIPEAETKKQPILGYQTGNQGWYDAKGGGPCDTYCRYTGLGPNIQWTCSDESDLSKLRTTSIKQSGRYCYDYDKKTNPSVKNGVVVKGNYFPTTVPEAPQSAGDYNFIIYNNKDADGIENFSNDLNDYANNYENIENFESQGTWSGRQANTDHPGNDIEVTSATSVADCQNKCVANPQCNGIVVDDARTSCWIKGTLTSPVSTPNRSTFLYTRGPGPYASGTNIGSPQVGTDYPGNDIVNEGVNNAQECATACQNLPGCKGFVTNASGNYCWLKGNMGSSTSNSDRVSYTYGPDKNPVSTDPRWKGPQKVDYPGNDIKSFSINQVSDCGTQCYNTPNCKGFVTTNAADYCWLKSDMSTSNTRGDRDAYNIDRNPTSTDPRWVGPEAQTTYQGNDIQIMSINKVSDCGEACAKNPACVGFITTDAADLCALKSAFGTKTFQSNGNAYKMKAHYEIEDNLSLSDCENVCQNDDTCKGFSYDSAKKSCVISQETLNPTGLNTNNIVGNKKVHMALNGTYNIYQNNSCVNSTLFNNDANVTASLGIATTDNGTPIIPQQPICPNQLNNNFIFGKNYEIMALDTDTLETDTVVKDCDFWDWNCNTSNTTSDQTINDARCLQANSDGSVSKENCVYTDNQKWTYDNSINSIRTWDGNCLNVDTSGQTIKVSTTPCVNDVNQQFYLKPVAENLQPKNYTVLDNFGNLNNNNESNIKENFATNTCINNYLSDNRNNQDYLYKLPYSPPYVKNINNIKENFESNTNNISTCAYLIYLIVLLLLLAILINRK